MKKHVDKKRKLVESVSSKYLHEGYKNNHYVMKNNNTSSQSQIKKRKDSPEQESQMGKTSNFNQYQHVYNHGTSNEANVNWVLRLRESDTASLLSKQIRNNSREKDLSIK